MALLHIIRYALLGLVLLFSLIVLGMSANLLHLSDEAFDASDPFEGLGVAVSVLTFVTIIPIIVIDFIRKGAVTSLVAVELAWVFVLMILWIAAAAETSATPLFVGGCALYDDDLQSICHQFQAIQAFAWLNFIILFGWLVTLIVSAAISHSRGHTGVWTSPVEESALFGRGSTATKPSGTATGNTTQGYPPQQHPGQAPAQMQQQGGYPQQSYSSPQPGTQGYATPPHQAPHPVAQV